MAKKILIPLFILAILLIGGGAYLIYTGTIQSNSKKETKSGYIRDSELGEQTDFEKENFDKQKPEVQEKMTFIKAAYKSYIPNDESFNSRIDVLKQCTVNYLDLSKESRSMMMESLGEDNIMVPDCDVDGMLQGVELNSSQKEYVDMLRDHFASYSEQQTVYEEQAKEWGAAEMAARPDIQDELDNVEYRLSYIEDGMAELFNKFFPML